jgi:hypothetical protein
MPLVAVARLFCIALCFFSLSCSPIAVAVSPADSLLRLFPYLERLGAAIFNVQRAQSMQSLGEMLCGVR